MVTEVIKRDGVIEAFDATKIKTAMHKALAVEGVPEDEETLDAMVEAVEVTLLALGEREGRRPTTEEVQDTIEHVFMQYSYFAVARTYILHRYLKDAGNAQVVGDGVTADSFMITRTGGKKEPYAREKMHAYLVRFAEGHAAAIDFDAVIDNVERGLYDGINTRDIAALVTDVLRSSIETDAAYSVVAARQLCDRVCQEVTGGTTTLTRDEYNDVYRTAFVRAMRRGVEGGQLDRRILSFDLEKMAALLDPARDNLFMYPGAALLHKKYLVRLDSGEVIETPQMMWMRIAMGVALNEAYTETRVQELYDAMSTLRFAPSNHSLMSMGTYQAASVGNTADTASDDIKHIFNVYDAISEEMPSREALSTL